MSAGPIPFLTPAQLSFTPGTPDFSSFTASELGNLGTDSDGFDTLLNETTALAGDAENVLISFDGDLADAGTTLAGLSGFDPASDQASLVSTAGAIDAALNDYNQIVQPAPNTGTPGTGTGGGGGPTGCTVQDSPYTFTKADFPPGSLIDNVISLFSYCAGQGPYFYDVQLPFADHSPYAISLLQFVRNDGNIFSASTLAEQFAGTFTGDKVRLFIQPTKAGQFLALVTVSFSPAGRAPYHLAYGTIVR